MYILLILTALLGLAGINYSESTFVDVRPRRVELGNQIEPRRTRAQATVVLSGSDTLRGVTHDVIGMNCGAFDDPGRVVDLVLDGFRITIERDPPLDASQTLQLRGITLRTPDGTVLFASWDRDATWHLDGTVLTANARFRMDEPSEAVQLSALIVCAPLDT